MVVRPMARLHRLLWTLIVVSLACPAFADDWPHWRGPARDDITDEHSGWDGESWLPAEAAWTARVGQGASSPIVVGDRIYAFGWRDGRETVSCLEAATGDGIWRQSYEAPKYGRHHVADEGWYRGPSSTPEYDADTGYLYTLGIDGQLTCWDTRDDGREVWRLNLYDAYGVGTRPDTGRGQRDYGYTTAPLVLGNWLIVEVGDDEGNLMGFDKKAGRRLWTSQCTDPAGHSGGLVPLTVEGIPCVAVFTLHRLLIARLDEGHEGETLTTHNWQTDYANNIPTPAVHGDSVILTSGCNMSRIARIRIGRNGTEKLWETRRFSQVCSPVIAAGRVYFAWQKLRCLDWETGQQRWAGGSFGHDASLIYTGDKRLIVFGARRLALVESAERSPGEYKELAVRDKIGSSHSWPHVVIADGRLFVRELNGHLYCFDVRD